MTKKDVEKLKVEAETRSLFGRKIKKLRKEGILPSNVFGKNIKSLPIQLSLASFSTIYNEAGENKIIYLTIKGEKEEKPVLVHNIQMDPVSGAMLHVDFHQVSLTEKVTSNVPVELIGEAPAVSQSIGILVRPLSEVEVEALPTQLPEKFEVDVSNLKNVDDSITVASIKVPSGVSLITSADQIVAKIEPPAKEEVAPSPEKPEGEAATESASEDNAGEKKSEGNEEEKSDKSSPEKPEEKQS